MYERKVSVLPGLLVFLVVAIVVIWAGSALAMDDPLWFLSTFTANASSIVLYWDGGQAVLEPGDPGYEALNASLQSDLRHVRAYPTGVGLSTASLESLRAEGRMLEVHYAQPVQVHSENRFAPTDVFYIPLSGYHGELDRVFSSTRSGPLELESTASIAAAAQTVARREGLGRE